MLTLTDYWMERDKLYPMQLSTDIRRNAEVTVKLVSEVMRRAAADGVDFEKHPVTKTCVSSGWRPPHINAKTPSAAANSKHTTGQACDVYDPDGDFDDWLMSEKGQAALAEIGLWIEHPSATKGWAHLQSVPPRSGRRVFLP